MRFNHLQTCYDKQIPFAGLALYDTLQARAAEQAGIDFLLVGDSLAHAYGKGDTTVGVTTEQVAYHTKAVSFGAPNTFLMADAPYLSYATLEQAISTSQQLMQAGAHCLKFEVKRSHLPVIEALCAQGVNVCAHVGLTPQHVHQDGAFRLQGRSPEAAQALVALAKACEMAGANVLLLECVPAMVAADIVGSVNIPVIGIGAGLAPSGQILVASDVIGLTASPPRFSKNFLCKAESIQQAFASYREQVVERNFPTEAHYWRQ